MMRLIVLPSLLLVTLGVMGADDAALAELLQQASTAEWHGEYTVAATHYRKATEQFPEAAAAWAAYGEHLRFYAHDAKAADAAFQRALAATPADTHAQAFAWRGLGELAVANGREQDALKFFNKSLDAQPLADTYRSLCHFYVVHRDWKAAAKAAKSAVALGPNDPIAILLYAAQLYRAGNLAAAARQQRRAFVLAGLNADGTAKGAEPVHCCVYYNAAGYFAVIGDQATALRMLAAFFATPNHRHLTRAQILADPDFEGLHDSQAFAALLEGHVPAKSGR